MQKHPDLSFTALFQDGHAQRWLSFGTPHAILSTTRLEQVADVLAEIEHAVESRNLWAVGHLCYEAAPAFDPALRVHAPGEVPLVWFGLHDAPRVLEALPMPGPGLAPHYDWVPGEHAAQYAARIDRIRQWIAAGDVYQVNHTLRLTSARMEAPQSLFARMVRSNLPRYAAFLQTGRYTLCSASPELFFERDGDLVTSRPMKGTMARGLWKEDDVARARSLRQSAKDRAENVMIVDMVRHDLGRIARTGSVSVPRLFDIERYPTLWQMTSTVQARTSAGLVDLLRALFPAASITGAPKTRAMQIIAQTEDGPRGVYTGAIGYVAPGRRARFSVAIRTAVLDAQSHQVEYGTGGGIVWDSTSAAEYDECLLKARIVTDPGPSFKLLETLLWEPGQGYFLLEAHLDRLRASADHLDLPVDLTRVRTVLEAAVPAATLSAQRVRLLVDGTGACEVQVRVLDDVPSAPCRLAIADVPVRRHNPFLYHKTTHRQWYDEARAAYPDCDDVVLWNEAGEVTETTIANIVIERDGLLITPPLRCGLLAGVFRRVLLEQGRIQEASFDLTALRAAPRIFVINSVRKWREAALT